MAYDLGNGTIKPETVIAAGQRVILSFMRLGFFDDHSPDYPFSNASIDWSQLDSPAHRQLSQKAAAESTVLLKNDGILPMKSFGNVAVVGPFANCAPTSKKDPPGLCYLREWPALACKQNYATSQPVLSMLLALIRSAIVQTRTMETRLR